MTPITGSGRAVRARSPSVRWSAASTGRSGVGQPPAGQLESRVAAQPVEIVGVLIAAGDGEDAGAQDIGQQMGDPVLIAPVRNYLGEPLGDAEPTLSLGEQHDAAIRSDPSAIKGGGDLLALNDWKGERQQIIVGHGGRGALRSRLRVGLSNQILRQIKSLRYLRHPKSASIMNKTG